MFRNSFLALMVLPNVILAQSVDEEALMRATFADLNPLSIQENVEYCGYLGFTGDGELAVSAPTRGDTSSCLADEPMNLELIVASYHTHAGFSPDYSSELPSGTDMEGDEAEGIDGWVATPGGRLWYIDSVDMETWQICGVGCLPSDPNFIAGDLGVIERSYAYDDLVIKLDE